MNYLPEINPKKETERIISFFKKIQKQTSLKRVVLGLSGGIDSYTVFKLLKKSYSLKNIFVVYLPFETGFFSFYNEETKIIISLIKKENLPDENFFLIPLKEPAEKIFDQMKTLNKKGLDKLICEIKECFTCPDTSYINRVRAGNVLARLRMIFLFDIAKKINGLVCGTENKSENLLGYYTRFGDAASDIEPISHLYKTQVYQLARFLKVPQFIIDKSPSANLWKNQTDEKELGFIYKEADQVLYLYLEKKRSISYIKKLGFKNTEKIIIRYKNNSFKNLTPYKI